MNLFYELNFKDFLEPKRESKNVDFELFTDNFSKNDWDYLVSIVYFVTYWWSHPRDLN